jgi:indole-3-glycerol phosphate synthase
MTTILDAIVENKKREVAAAQRTVPWRDLERRLSGAPAVRDFQKALESPHEVRIIAEVKKASPSAGVLREEFDPVAIARAYEQHGAACVSVLTDAHYFKGHLSDLTAVREAVTIPVLRKDFILDPYQLLEARTAGADAVLLIAEILDDATLACLMREARGLGLQTLVEIHDAENLPRVVAAGAGLVGINNRDLRTFTTRLEHTLTLVKTLPPQVCVVSESGIHRREDLERLREAGVRAALVGETLMRAPDIGQKLRELRGLGQALEHQESDRI